MYRYARIARQNKAGSKTRTPLRRQAPADVLEDKNFEMRLKAKGLLIRPVSEAYEGDAVAASPSSFLAPVQGPLTGAFMFPDLARDDVFRLETPRLWLRWPQHLRRSRRSTNFAAYGKSPATPPASPIPIRPARPSGSSMRRGRPTPSGRDLTLVMTPIKGKRDAVGSISLESRGTDRLALGYVLAPEAWGKGLATEAAEAMIDAAFGLTRRSRSWPASGSRTRPRRRAREVRLCALGTGPQGAPARGGLVECHSFRLDPRGLGGRRRACGARRPAALARAPDRPAP